MKWKMWWYEFAERRVRFCKMERDRMIGRKTDKRNSVKGFRVCGKDADSVEFWIGWREGEGELCSGWLSNPFPLRRFHHGWPVGQLCNHSTCRTPRHPTHGVVSRSSWWSVRTIESKFGAQSKLHSARSGLLHLPARSPTRCGPLGPSWRVHCGELRIPSPTAWETAIASTCSIPECSYYIKPYENTNFTSRSQLNRKLRPEICFRISSTLFFVQMSGGIFLSIAAFSAGSPKASQPIGWITYCERLIRKDTLYPFIDLYREIQSEMEKLTD